VCDADEITAVLVREIERRLAIRGMCKPGRASTVNEAHGQRSDVLRARLVALERMDSLWYFTAMIEWQATLFEDAEARAAWPSGSRSSPRRHRPRAQMLTRVRKVEFETYTRFAGAPVKRTRRSSRPPARVLHSQR
jgi:hypothetical protein